MLQSASEVSCKYGRLVSKEGRLELWMPFSGSSSSPGVEHLVVSWNIGNCSLVLSVPHAGTLGADQTLHCPSGHVLETRKGSLEHPLKSYGRDAGTDFIADGIESLLDMDGMRPHVIACHMHRNKVEVNRDISKKAVQHRGKEGEFIYSMYHRWISQALHLSRECMDVGAALLVDLHGHGHPHNYIELGYRIPGHMLNEIVEGTGTKPSKQKYTVTFLEELKYFSIPDSYLDKNLDEFEESCKKIDWQTIVTSPVKHEFTMSKLMRRNFGGSSDSIKEGLIGSTSFGGCLSKHLGRMQPLTDVGCIPSLKKPSPGRLGYYTGGYTVLKHAKWKGVDAVQVELPVSVRTKATEKREAVTVALARGIQEFHQMHYQATLTSITQGIDRIGYPLLYTCTYVFIPGKNIENEDVKEVEDEVDNEAPLKKSVVKVPLCQVKWSWKGKKLMRIS